MLLPTIAVSLVSAAVGATLGRRLQVLDDALWDGGVDADAELPARPAPLKRSASLTGVRRAGSAQDRSAGCDEGVVRDAAREERVADGAGDLDAGLVDPLELGVLPGRNPQPSSSWRASSSVSSSSVIRTT
jgi:hypothetical protein